MLSFSPSGAPSIRPDHPELHEFWVSMRLKRTNKCRLVQRTTHGMSSLSSTLLDFEHTCTPQPPHMRRFIITIAHKTRHLLISHSDSVSPLHHYDTTQGAITSDPQRQRQKLWSHATQRRQPNKCLLVSMSPICLYVKNHPLI